LKEQYQYPKDGSREQLLFNQRALEDKINELSNNKPLEKPFILPKLKLPNILKKHITKDGRR